MRSLAATAVAVVALAGLIGPGAWKALAAGTASVADLVLPAVTYSHTAQTTSGSMTLTVTNDLGDGWNVTISASDFVYSGLYSGTAIPAGNFAITAANAPSVTSGQAIDPVGGPRVPSTGATGTLDVARKVLQADAGYGVGTYSQLLDVQLTVPAMSRAGTYTSSLTVTVGAGP